MEADALKMMKRKRRNLLLVLTAGLMAALTAGVLCACAQPDREQQIIEQGYVCEVTYDANGGSFDTAVSAPTATVRVKENSFTLEPGYVPEGAGSLNTVAAPVRTYYDLMGWLPVTVDEEGNEVVGTEYWDFYSDRVTGNMTLRADWRKQGEVFFNITVGGEVVSFADTYHFSPGASFISTLYDRDRDGGYTLREDYVRDRVRVQSADDKEYTMLGFYYDAALTQPVTDENAVYPEDNPERLDLYARYLEGNYTILSQETLTASTILRSNSNWYLIGDIDFSDRNGEPMEWNTLASFEGSILGNGHSITGIAFTSRVYANDLKPVRSVFGEMKGRVEDLTIKDVNFTVWSGWFDATYDSADASQQQPQITIAFLASSFAGGAFQNVALEGCTIGVINATREDTAGRGFGYTVSGSNWCTDDGSEGSSVTGTAAFTGETEDDELTGL